VPRDLETICLKCLRKEPERRYGSAAALADDLQRFLEGRPIQARPLGWGARLWRWSRRNPTAAALLASALALVGLASGAGVWLVQQRAWRATELRNDVRTAVAQAESLRKGFHFHEARALLEQVRQRLEPAGPNDLRRQVDQAQADLDLAVQLDAARMQGATLVSGRVDPSGAAEPRYAAAFAQAGLGPEGNDSDSVAARVRDSAVYAELVAALDDWASLTPDRGRRAWLLEVARKADPDPTRARLRQPELWEDSKLWRDPDRVIQLARDLRGAEFSPQLATALGRVSRARGGDAVPLLTAVQARFPEDFWLNSELGAALLIGYRPAEALSYYRAALALRPNTSATHQSLGAVLLQLRRVDEAMDHLREAIRLDSQNVWAHANLANAYRDKGRVDEAIDQFQEALRIDPRDASIHTSFGRLLREIGRLDEARKHLDEALRLDPDNYWAHDNLALMLLRQGRVDEALDHIQQALKINPRDTSVLCSFGIALRTKGRLDEAMEQFRQVIRLDPNYASAYAHLAFTLDAKGRTDEAIDHYQQAARLNPNDSAVHNNLGVLLSAKGRLDEAIDHFQQSIQLDPRAALANAARAAASTATGQGPQARQLSEPERAGLRRQALARLRASLELATKLRNEGQIVGWSLASWQGDPALAGVRDPAALAKLPDAERQQWQRLWRDVAAHIAADPLEQGRAQTARRDWAQAARNYARAMTHDSTNDGHFWFEYAALLLLAGDRPGYAKACAHMMERHGKDGGPRSYHLARACTLAPDAVADASQPGRLAEKELQGAARQFWSLTEQGALAYRAGRFHDAVSLFEQSLQADSTPGRAVINWLWLALAQQRLGKADEARRWLNKAQAWLDQFGDGMPARAEEEFGLHLHNWLEAHVLRREVEALIQPKGSPRK
jgi:tetratricopeptide (TPR) repeat protein